MKTIDSILINGEKLVEGDSVEIYDSCHQCNMIERVVRICEYGQFDPCIYIYSSRKNWQRVYDERLSSPSDIKCIIKKGDEPKPLKSC